jgi:hypothetical protein
VQLFLRRLLAWLSGRPIVSDRKLGSTFDEPAIDLDEFSRLLKSRNAEDLKAIARAMSKSKETSKQP